MKDRGKKKKQRKESECERTEKAAAAGGRNSWRE
jgi:hypothetical protein